MVCLGNLRLPATSIDAEAAQLYIVSLFRTDFLSRYPTGIVISEYEYMGRTTKASGTPTPIRMPGQPRLNKILDALAHDFRRWNKNGDFRKCDALGISNDGLHAELLEVTTVDNAISAITQINSKLAILRETVNRIHNLPVDWRASRWKPGPTQMFYLVQNNSFQKRYVCFQPTINKMPPDGVILYEVHVLTRTPVLVPAPEKIKEKIPEENIEERARRFLADHPYIAIWIRGLAMFLSAAAAIAAIAAALEPMPGDEFAAGAFASALFRIATE